MTMNDPIADMLTRIRNAVMVRHDFVLVPASRMKVAIAGILKEEGFINHYEVLGEPKGKALKIHLAYTERRQPLLTALQRVSKPGLRVYVSKAEIPRVY